jgi:hypothetical protein
MLKSSSSITEGGRSSSSSRGDSGGNGASAGSIFDIDPEKDVSYINLTILDASQAVEAMVKEKIAETEQNNSKFFSLIRPPEKFRNKVNDKIASAVANNVPVSTIAKSLAESMPKILMYKIATKTGMRLAAETVFVEDSFVVIQFQVQYVDSQKLLGLIKSKSKTTSFSSGGADEVNDDDDDDDDDDSVDPDPKVVDEWIQEQKELGLEGGSEFFYDDDTDNKEGATTTTVGNGSSSSSSNINNSNSKGWKEWIVDCLEWAIQQLLPFRDRAVKNLEHDHLPAILQTKITEQMQSMMELKLAKKNLEADISVLPSKDQSRYFYSNLTTVRNHQEQKEK